MKKIAVWGLMVLCLPLGLFAQTVPVYEAASNHYQVYSEISADHALRLSRNLDSLFSLYNSYFRFVPTDLTTKLKVRIMANKGRYDEYLTKIIARTRDDFIYLHYTDPEKSELVGFAADEENFRISLNHQSFIQFLRAFVPNPPLWIREGFAVFFENTVFDPAEETAVYRENLSWLDTLKNLAAGGGSRLLPLETILLMNVDEVRDNIEVFYPQAWGMVSFLVNSTDRDYSRILWDSLSTLRRDAFLDRNSELVYNRAFAWHDRSRMAGDFLAYLEGRKSFRSLVQAGIELYTGGNLDSAEAAFLEARELDGKSFVPPYYLGLINYGRKNYSTAAGFYRKALDGGAEPALVYYALGINSMAENRVDDAVTYLKMAGEMDSSYRQKGEDLIRRMRR